MRGSAGASPARHRAVSRLTPSQAFLPGESFLRHVPILTHTVPVTRDTSEPQQDRARRLCAVPPGSCLGPGSPRCQIAAMLGLCGLSVHGSLVAEFCYAVTVTCPRSRAAPVTGSAVGAEKERQASYFSGGAWLGFGFCRVEAPRRFCTGLIPSATRLHSLAGRWLLG